MSGRGRIHFVGGGPGDPGLIAVKGLELLKASALVLAPGFYKDTYAEYLAGKEYFDPFDFHFTEVTGRIEGCLAAGHDAVLLVPGDLAMFSPVQSIIDRFRRDADFVPGISTLNAAASVLGRTFDLPGVSHTTIATSPKTITGSRESIGALAKHGATMVLFMNNKTVEALSAELLEGYAPDTPVAIVSNISLPGQAVIMTTIGGLKGAVDPDWFLDEDVFKIIVVGGILGSKEDPSWWDRRKDLRDARHAAKRAGKGPADGKDS
jgi:precorrin-4/cobalt-precorrin-4 C11-methyltransferase